MQIDDVDLFWSTLWLFDFTLVYCLKYQIVATLNTKILRLVKIPVVTTLDSIQVGIENTAFLLVDFCIRDIYLKRYFLILPTCILLSGGEHQYLI